MFQPLHVLAEDYDAALKTQQKVIDAFRARLHKALEAGDFAEVKRLNTQLRILYDEKDELQTRSHELRSYLKRSQ